MTIQNSSVFLFDDVRVEPSTFRVFKAGDAVSLEPKAVSLLLFLIENRGRLIEKDEILDTIWEGTNVTENALAREIGKLRKALGDDPKAARYIQTVHTRGYHFIAEVKQTDDATHVSETDENPVAPADVQSNLRPATEVLSSPNNIPEAARPKPRLPAWKAVALSSAIFVGLLSGGLLWRRHMRSVQPPPASPIFSVAVLPFKISGGGQDDEYLGVEIADAL